MANREEKTRALINYVLEYAVDKGYSLKDLEFFEVGFRNEMYSLESLLKGLPLNNNKRIVADLETANRDKVEKMRKRLADIPIIARDVLAAHVSDLQGDREED